MPAPITPSEEPPTPSIKELPSIKESGSIFVGGQRLSVEVVVGPGP